MNNAATYLEFEMDLESSAPEPIGEVDRLRPEELSTITEGARIGGNAETGNPEKSGMSSQSTEGNDSSQPHESIDLLQLDKSWALSQPVGVDIGED
jgi:hypothetical protein